MMQSVNRLIAFSLVFIMMFVLVHNTFPHEHHSREAGAFLYDQHSSDIHHQQAGDSEDDQKKPSLLDFLFNHHAQSLQDYHYTLLAFGHKAPVAKLVVKAFGFTDTFAEARRGGYVKDRRPVYLARALPDDLRISSPPDRGPPSFG